MRAREGRTTESQPESSDRAGTTAGSSGANQPRTWG